MRAIVVPLFKALPVFSFHAQGNMANQSLPRTVSLSLVLTCDCLIGCKAETNDSTTSAMPLSFIGAGPISGSESLLPHKHKYGQ